MRSGYISPENFNKLALHLQPANLLACVISLKTGLRIDDVLSLKIENINQRMSVVEKKTGKRRRIYLNKKMLDCIFKFVGNRVAGFVFQHRLDKTKHRTRQAVFKDIKKQVEFLGLNIHVSPHSFRKVYAVNLYKRTKSLAAVQKNLGHAKIETTLIYALADVIK